MLPREDVGRFRRYDNSARPTRRVAPARPQPFAEVVASPKPVAPLEVTPTLVNLPVEAEPEVAAPAEVTTPVPVAEAKPRPKINLPRLPRRHAMAVSGLACMLIVGVSGGILLAHQPAAASPIPGNYQSVVDYPTYCPDPAKLPAGFKLDAASVSSPAKDIILYKINYASGHLTVTLQDKPSSSNLQAFNSQRIPLHTSLQTPVGQATIGAIGSQSVVSLPTNSKTWIIVTAPYDIKQNQLDQVLKSFKS